MAERNVVGGVEFSGSKIQTRDAVKAYSIGPDAVDGSTIQRNNTTGALEVPDEGIGADQMAYAAGKWLHWDLVASDSGGGILSQANPAGVDLWIMDLIVVVATNTTGACTADFGTSAGASTSSDNMLDGVDLNTADFAGTAVDADLGTNGVAIGKWTAAKYLTGSMASGATAGLVGTASAYVIAVSP
jgi:hypothetical protein